MLIRCIMYVPFTEGFCCIKKIQRVLIQTINNKLNVLHTLPKVENFHCEKGFLFNYSNEATQESGVQKCQYTMMLRKITTIFRVSQIT